MSREIDTEGYRSNELNSLGIQSKRMNEPNDCKEMRDLVEKVKQVLLQEYRTAFEYE
jgi:hypothetical protein